jgi:hypothetical protein
MLHVDRCGEPAADTFRPMNQGLAERRPLDRQCHVSAHGSHVDVVFDPASGIVSTGEDRENSAPNSSVDTQHEYADNSLNK